MKNQQKNKFSNKDKWKIVRSVFQALVILLAIYFIGRQFIVVKKYEPYNKQTSSYISAQSNMQTTRDNGFVSLSYFGVSTEGSETLISTECLETHIKLLKDRGYVTITQQDIYDYYADGKQLPEKALFLMFEDGRRDTAIFSQKILEQYNYKATMLTYAKNFLKYNNKFLTADDLQLMEKSSFWEFGTNGYRLAFINTFDRYDNYIGELNVPQYKEVLEYIDRDYNHYLMDFIRDENNIPKETYGELHDRFEYDYTMMNEVYTQEFGELPRLYTLMHSNTGMFGTNENASDENKEYIYKMFDMNVNREGNSYNTLDNSIYDLTRMQPQPYWNSNHLLMRIWDDTGCDMEFEIGDEQKAMGWERIDGQAEFLDESIIITTMPDGKGTYKLKDVLADDVAVDVVFDGNRLGSQGIYLRADDELSEYIYIRVVNNDLIVTESLGGAEKELFKICLDVVDGVEYITLAEDERDSIITAKEVIIDSQQDREIKSKLQDELDEYKSKQIDDDGSDYVPRIQLKDEDSRNIEIVLKDNLLDINIDGKIAVKELETKVSMQGNIYLESIAQYGYSQRNLVDDVYDGVFNKLVVKDAQDNEKVLYDNTHKGITKVINAVEKQILMTVHWFIDNL